jgi:hypothetical protein
MSVNLIVEEFLKTNPRKRFPDKRWKHTNPEKYEAAVKLYNMGYSIPDIAKHIGCKYDVLRKTMLRDKIITSRKYKKATEALKELPIE